MPYHKLAHLVTASRPRVLLDISVAKSSSPQSVHEAASALRSARTRIMSAMAFVPDRDLKGVESVVVLAKQKEPELSGSELRLGPNVERDSILKFFGGLVFDGLKDEQRDKWISLFQSERNAGRRLVCASDPRSRFADAYALFHCQPRKLREDSSSAYDFLEGMYGKRINEIWKMIGGGV